MGYLRSVDASDLCEDDLSVSSVAKKTQVFVKHSFGTLSLQVDLAKDVLFLKEVVEKRLQRSVSDEYFVYHLKELEPGNTLLSYGIKRDSHICLTPRLRGGRRRFKTLLRFFLKHKNELLKLVELPDGSHSVELTYVGCMLLASWLCCFLRAFASGKSWAGSFNLSSFLVHRWRVQTLKKPTKYLNPRNLYKDCTGFTRFLRVMFVLNNQLPPYLLQLLNMLESLTMEDLTADTFFALATHLSLVPSLNRVSLVYLIKRKHDGCSFTEQKRFKTEVDRCSMQYGWLEDLLWTPLFRDVIVGGWRRNVVYHPNHHQTFILIRNYNTHGPEYSWIDHDQWFSCNNNGMELMVPKYTLDYLLEVVDTLIQKKFDIKDELMACAISCCAREDWKKRIRENNSDSYKRCCKKRRSSSLIDPERSDKTKKRRRAEKSDRRGSKKRKQL
ncbi:hypothetical protein SEVIR_8G139450v4 [Setaria viridis]